MSTAKLGNSDVSNNKGDQLPIAVDITANNGRVNAATAGTSRINAIATANNTIVSKVTPIVHRRSFFVLL